MTNTRDRREYRRNQTALLRHLSRARDAIEEVRDQGQWDEAVAEEEKQKEQLAKVSAKWATIIKEL